MPTVSKNFPVLGMTCASCAVSLETFLRPMEGVQHIQVNYATQQLEVIYEVNEDLPMLLKQRAKEIGYTLVIDEDASDVVKDKEIRNVDQLKRKLLIATIFSLPVFILSMFFMDAFPYQNYILLGLTLPVMVFAGSDFFTKAWLQIKHKQSTMDTLVALSTGIAFLFSLVNTVWPKWLTSSGQPVHVYYESAVVIITFILFGRYIEERAKENTKAALHKLIGLSPKHATVIRNGEEHEVETSQIMLGDLVVVKPGDKIPVDGKIKRGSTTVNESLITGEAIPVEKTKGDSVVAGSINHQGVVQILALKVGDETTLAEIIRLVTHAQNSKPKIQKLVDKIAGIFVPIVVLIAIITALVWLIVGPFPQYQYAITTSITVLIVACPCALGLATPTALMVGIGLGSANGILVRDAQALETLHKADAIILDKTGTLTQGIPEVVDDAWVDDDAKAKYAKVLLAIEKLSRHPLANSIVAYLGTTESETIEVGDIESHVGLGMVATYDGKHCGVGSRKFIDASGVTIPPNLQTRLQKWESQAITPVCFSVGLEVVAIIALADKLKPTSKAFIRELSKMHVQPVVLSGDIDQTVRYVANELGVVEYKGGQSPEDKGLYIKQLQQSGCVVAMVGDGINDAVALSQADIGIAMGNGSDVAIESAGITLMHADPQHVTKAVQLSKATIRTIRQNLFWAFIYNVIAIPIAAGILYPINGFLLHPMIAGAAMSLSSVSVLLNSLRLKKIRL